MDVEPFIYHLRYGIIITDQKRCRFLIARVHTEDRPLVFLRRCNDPKKAYDCYYCLYESALTAAQADEILALLKNNEKRKANTLFKKYFKKEGVLCARVWEMRLDDAVPDAWYDVWKEFEDLITIQKDVPGYFEADVMERGIFGSWIIPSAE
ncbi:MAG: hypothetical protein IKD69_06065 [Solobacterium sp.]|nr:hypothetical protein [Solobacterium sp.]